MRLRLDAGERRLLAVLSLFCCGLACACVALLGFGLAITVMDDEPVVAPIIALITIPATWTTFRAARLARGYLRKTVSGRRAAWAFALAYAVVLLWGAPTIY